MCLAKNLNPAGENALTKNNHTEKSKHFNETIVQSTVDFGLSIDNESQSNIVYRGQKWEHV